VACSKALFLALAVRKLLRVSRHDFPPDDIDSADHKLFTTAGRTLATKIRQLFRTFIKKFTASVLRNVETNKYVQVPDIFSANSGSISNNLRFCMSSGNFSVRQNSSSTQAGVSQVHNSMNLLSRLAHLTIVNAPLNRDGKQPRPRQLLASHYRVFCAADTPEGRSVGLLNHHTIFQMFSMGHDGHVIAQVLLGLPCVYPITAESLEAGGVAASGRIMVMVNGCFSAYTDDPELLVRTLFGMRRSLALPSDIGFVYDQRLRQVVVHAEDGEAVAPVIDLAAAGGAPDLPHLRRVWMECGDAPETFFQELMYEGILVLQNKHEEAYNVVAMSIDDVRRCPSGTYTHMEIDPNFSLYGVVANCTPFSNRNQGPRNIYATSMLKQALAAEHPTFQRFQLDVQSHVLQYPQRPLVTTAGQRLIGLDEEPCMQQVVICFLPADGNNQEDAIVVSRSSLQLGLFRSAHYVTVRESEKTHGPKDVECFGIPPEGARGVKRGSFAAIDPTDGLPIEGCVLSPRDVVVAKYLTHSVVTRSPDGATSSKQQVSDRSLIYKGTHPMRVEKVLVTSRNGVRSVCVRLIALHMPNEGDKFASLCSQKGVFTEIRAKENMPFNCDGITPDILVDAHGITSRMTPGQVIEMLASKYAAQSGRLVDGTAFRKLTPPRLVELLRSVGHTTMEHMTCGMSGRPLGPAMMGIASYMPLKHQSHNKDHARNTGPRSAMTGQPVEGRSNDGGLRIGAMELGTLVSVGAADVAQDRLMYASDATVAHLCECGEVAAAPEPEVLTQAGVRLEGRRMARCSRCQRDQGQGVQRAVMPYPMLLLKRLLGGASIQMDFPYTAAATDAADEEVPVTLEPPVEPSDVGLVSIMEEDEDEDEWLDTENFVRVGSNDDADEEMDEEEEEA